MCVCTCVRTAQPTGFGKLAFYARIQRLMLQELGVGGLLLTAVWRGERWATEVLDKVQGLVHRTYMKCTYIYSRREVILSKLLTLQHHILK